MHSVLLLFLNLAPHFTFSYIFFQQLGTYLYLSCSSLGCLVASLVIFLVNLKYLLGVFESKLMELADPEARKAYLDETKCTSVLDKIIVQVSPDISAFSDLGISLYVVPTYEVNLSTSELD